MFRVKICGITSVEDALAAAAAGADAIGLNCYPQSPRYCPSEIAAKIAQAVPKQVCKVGVFVGATAAEIRGAVETIGLDLVQLHGDEPPALVAELRGLAVMKAFRLGDDYSIVADYLRECHQLACVPRMVLVDALRTGQFGGTGETLDWPKLSRRATAIWRRAAGLGRRFECFERGGRDCRGAPLGSRYGQRRGGEPRQEIARANARLCCRGPGCILAAGRLEVGQNGSVNAAVRRAGWIAGRAGRLALAG